MNETHSLWLPDEISYCSNVHAGESFDAIKNVLRGFVSEVRKARRLDRMSAGLWLSAAAADEIDGDERKGKEFSKILDDCGINLLTLNGFPFGDFHQSSVKEHVYFPSWNEQRRVDYTLQLARILAHNLPDTEHEGSISTLPIAYRRDWSAANQLIATDKLCQLTAALRQLQLDTDKKIRICLEMEPGCVLESTDEVIRFFTEDLIQSADRLNINPQWISDHLGICYDICHQAVMFEDPADSLARLERAGISIGKIQISSAMHVQQPDATGVEILLADFTEPKYLHQVRSSNKHGKLRASEDLDVALSGGKLPKGQPWRIHFHVPIQSATLHSEILQTTQNEIGKVFDYLRNNPSLHPHLEVETYTWQVLPEQLCPANDAELIRGLKNELQWVETELRRRDLLAATLTKQTMVENHAP